MNKAELVAAVAAATGVHRKEAEKFLKSFQDVVTAELQKGEKVQLVGFGTFEVGTRPARTGINPRTKAPIEIGSAKTPKFRAGKALKDAVNK